MNEHVSGDLMRFSELSERLKTFLSLGDSPVGVKLIKAGEKPPSIAEPESPISYCASIARARKGETLFMGRDKHICKLGAANLGLIALPEANASGKSHAGVIFKSTDAAIKTISQIPRLSEGTVQATLVFPLEKAPVEPDVVILSVNPTNGLWVTLSLDYAAGGRVSSSFAGIGGTCGDATVLPYLSGKPNFSVGDFGGRKNKSPEDIIVGLPAALLEEVVGSLEKLPAK